MKARVVGRALLAVVAGYAAMIVIAPAITAILRGFWPVASEPAPPAWYSAIDLAYSLGAVAVGGYLCAVVARSWLAPVILAVASFVLGLVTAVGAFDPAHSAWYVWGSALLSPLAVLAGARYWTTRRRSPHHAG